MSAGTPGPGRTGDTITRDELTAFCVRHRDYGVPTAGAIWDDILAHREPEYERGQFYQDATGTVFFRVLGCGDGWSTMPEGKPYPHDYPRRPLRRLVPEGSPPAGETTPAAQAEADAGRVEAAAAVLERRYPGTRPDVLDTVISELQSIARSWRRMAADHG